MKSTLDTLVNFNGTNGSGPTSNLIADAHGNLFGTTFSGGAFNDGSVFEIAHGSNHLTTLVSFTNGANPNGSLAIDANGDLFGTTLHGRAFGIRDPQHRLRLRQPPHHSGQLSLHDWTSHGADALRTFATGYDDDSTATSSDYRVRRTPPPRMGTHWSA